MQWHDYVEYIHMVSLYIRLQLTIQTHEINVHNLDSENQTTFTLHQSIKIIIKVEAFNKYCFEFNYFDLQFTSVQLYFESLIIKNVAYITNPVLVLTIFKKQIVFFVMYSEGHIHVQEVFDLLSKVQIFFPVCINNSRLTR